MRILQGAVAVNAGDIKPRIGELYQYPYGVIIRSESKNNEIIGTIDPYSPFVVLEKQDFNFGKSLKILTTNGEIGYIWYNPKYLKEFVKV